MKDFAENLSSRHAQILLYISNGLTAYHELVSELNKNEPSLRTPETKVSVASLKNSKLLTISEDALGGKIELTTLGKSILDEIQERYPEKLLSESELKGLSQETQKVMMVTTK